MSIYSVKIDFNCLHKRHQTWQKKNILNFLKNIE